MPSEEKSVPIRKALISVYDKTGLDRLCPALVQRGVEIFSTGGTAKYLADSLGIQPTLIESVTQFPEMMDGRVKTLHPKVFGGVLARRSHAKDLEEVNRFGIPLFDLIVVNLYPFWETLEKSTAEQCALIDVGGPSLLRASAKNHESVAVLSHCSQYDAFLHELDAQSGKTSLAFRQKLAVEVFERTSQYDLQIAQTWNQDRATPPKALPLSPINPLRYGENPHQAGFWSGTQDWKVLQGKEISYNNLLDLEAAVRITREFTEPAVSIIKHCNPCGVAARKGTTIRNLFELALEADSRSAFGGIVSFNVEVDEDTASALVGIFLEVVEAPGFSAKAREVLAQKKNLRLVEWKKPHSTDWEVRSALGGWLVQQTDKPGQSFQHKTVTKTPLATEDLADLEFAWKVVKHARSNAVVIAQGGITRGIGSGQTSRVEAVELALQKLGKSAQRAVLASEAFFPFRDNIDLVHQYPVKAIIQPGGSQRDSEVIAACDEYGIAMAFTGTRHFRH